MVFFIAEIGINHNGDMKLAKELITTSYTSGCDAVKFQKRDIDTVYTEEYLNESRESPFGKTQREQKVLLFDDSPRWEIARALLKMTIQQNHNATVLKFSKHRKEKEDGSNISRKSSS